MEQIPKRERWASSEDGGGDNHGGGDLWDNYGDDVVDYDVARDNSDRYYVNVTVVTKMLLW